MFSWSVNYLGCSFFSGYVLCLLSLLEWCSFVVCAVITEDNNSTRGEYMTSNYQLILICVFSAIFLVCLAVYAMFQCGDCYNSEVSSMSHPACSTVRGQTDGHKWGGSDGGYIASTFGEVINPNDRNMPSYGIIPTEVESESGLLGYSMSHAPTGGNYDPLRDNEEPPPPYSTVR